MFAADVTFVLGSGDLDVREDCFHVVADDQTVVWGLLFGTLW